MQRLWNGIKLVWLNAGFYSALLLMTVVGIGVVSGPLYCWFRYVRCYSRGWSVRMLIWLYGRAWAKLVAFFVPLRLENCGGPLPSPCIFVPNHQSFFDTYCFGFLPEPNVVFAVRAWPFRIPFYGLYMRYAEYLNVEETAADEMFATATELLARGTSVTIFPEGTRSRDGNLQRFHSGAFRLAFAANIPIVPICIFGTGQFLRRGGFLLRPATVSVRVLPPVHPQDYAQHGVEAHLVLRRSVKAQLQLALDDLLGEKSEEVTTVCQKEFV